jgi:hypothetical protein
VNPINAITIKGIQLYPQCKKYKNVGVFQHKIKNGTNKIRFHKHKYTEKICLTRKNFGSIRPIKSKTVNDVVMIMENQLFFNVDGHLLLAY